MKNILRSLALAGACGLASLVNAESNTNSVEVASEYSTNAVSYVDYYTNSISNAYTNASSKAVSKADSTGKVYSLGVAPVKSANLESAVTSTNVKIADSVKYPEFTALEILPSDPNDLRIKLSLTVYSGDVNSYRLQTSGDLRSTNNWIDSSNSANLEIFNDVDIGRDCPSIFYEPFNSSNKFYRLVQNEVAN